MMDTAAGRLCCHQVRFRPEQNSQGLARLQGPDDAAKKRAHPAAIAHAARVARAQQMGASWLGYKIFPDLTPGRAFMWGSIMAVYAVGAASMVTAQALDIKSVCYCSCVSCACLSVS